MCNQHDTFQNKREMRHSKSNNAMLNLRDIMSKNVRYFKLLRVRAIENLVAGWMRSPGLDIPGIEYFLYTGYWQVSDATGEGRAATSLFMHYSRSAAGWLSSFSASSYLSSEFQLSEFFLVFFAQRNRSHTETFYRL